MPVIINFVLLSKTNEDSKRKSYKPIYKKCLCLGLKKVYFLLLGLSLKGNNYFKKKQRLIFMRLKVK